MKSIIVYGSEYGSTRAYAKRLSELTEIRAVSFQKIKNISEYDKVIYIGGLYAGSAKGLKQTAKNIRADAEVFIITVGLMGCDTEKNKEMLRNQVAKQVPAEIMKRAKRFHLRGAIDYSKMSFKHKAMMKALCTVLKAKPADKRDADSNMIINSYNKKFDLMNFEDLNEIAEVVK